MYATVARLAPVLSTASAIASACNESDGIVRKNRLSSGKSSSRLAEAVGEQATTPASMISPRPASALVDDAGPMIASTLRLEQRGDGRVDPDTGHPSSAWTSTTPCPP